MSLGSENKRDWRPCCDFESLQRRAWMLAQIRQYFHDREVLEVETPLLGSRVGTDPHLRFMTVQEDDRILYLQTSPEFAMKRLLAAGSGSIYQICKAFRGGEVGRLHNPEFTLLEWYRVGFDLDQLMDDVASLLRCLLQDQVGGEVRLRYGELFEEAIGVSWDAPIPELNQRARALDLAEAGEICGRNRSLWLDFLFSHLIQPGLPDRELVFVHEYPAPLAALASLKPGQPQTAERFEVFLHGVELGNGYRELTEPTEQRARFEAEQKARILAGLPCPELDESFLAALEEGMPQCSGVAIGLDRVLMLMMGHDSIERVLPFPMRVCC